ncbi:DUF4270 domain-containing protein [uncultured Bacteroides sp.]|uniref:DUF4270 domain-containing protein n=1 Tax=uncultured Bacteroides sp. TaxID=162156 RepID=UPI0026104219|nr:DUF4270 domain-containing protein [uncultured Bacteroides sp.]
MKLKFLAALAIAATLYSCDDETVGIGQFVVDDDLIPAKATTYPVVTSTHLMDSVYSRSSTAYLGKFTDQDYGTFSSDFLTQINCPENFQLPDRTVEIANATLGLYYTSYFGDSLATLRLEVNKLTKVIEDNGKNKELYYSNLNPDNYYDPNTPCLATKDYSAYDQTVSDSLRNSGDYYPNVSVSLGKEFCDNFLEKYNYTETKNGKTIHPYFKDSESFINNVLKGFYVHTTAGEGSILYISDIYLHLTVKYWTTIKNNSTNVTKDTLVYSMISMAATKEVFMSTRFKNSNLASLKDNKECTYIKSPAGLCTEVTLPIEEMYNEHKTDTLNSISISFPKLKSTYDGPYKMGTPNNLLLVQKDKMKKFFEGGETYDNKTSFLSTYSSVKNSYTFSQLNRLVSNIFTEIRPEIEKGTSSWEAWKRKNPGWNKVLLVPVTTETDSQGNIIGVENDLNVNSASLLRGDDPETSDNEENRITMSVIFTQPHKR